MSEAPEFLDEEEERAEAEPMSDREITALIDRWAEKGMNEDTDEVSRERTQIYDYYRMQPYGGEEENYSSAVTGEVLETVEWAMPSLMRVFLTGSPVKFVPVGQEDVAQAKQETDVVSWVMRTQNDCYSELSQWFREALLYPNAYLKVWWERKTEYDFEEYEGITEEQLQGLAANDQIEIMAVEQSTTTRSVMNEMAQVVQVEVPQFAITLRADRLVSRLRFEAVPPEEVRVSPKHTTLNLDDADYVIHSRTDMTRSDLLSMGYDFDLVMSLDEVDDELSSQEKTGRRDTLDENPGLYEGSEEESLQRVEYMEAYCRMDVDGDGYAERRKICKSGIHVLLNKHDSYQPFCALTCIIQPHRHIGMSLAETAAPIQLQNSVLTRQTLDNLYRTNRPRAVGGRSIDRDAFDNYVPHSLIDGDPRELAWEQVPVAVQHVLPFLQYQDDQLASKTGISKHSMGLDADTLAQSTMGAYLEAAGASSQRMEMLIRSFAETGMQQLVRKIHELLRKHQDQELEAEIAGEWVNVNPREWRERTNIVPTVGIGHGSHRERAASAMQILELQNTAEDQGMTTRDRIYTTLSELVQSLGRHDASAYFVDPKSPEGQQIAKSMAQQAQAQQQAMQEQVQQQVAVQMEAIQAQLQASMAKTMQALAKAVMDNQRQWADMELGHAVDVVGMGIDKAQVVPMPAAGGGNGEST